MKNREARARKVTVSIPADLFSWGEQERAKQEITRSAFVASLYRHCLEEAAARERLARYAAAYARQPQGADEHEWAESAAASLAALYRDE